MKSFTTDQRVMMQVSLGANAVAVRAGELSDVSSEASCGCSASIFTDLPRAALLQALPLARDLISL